MFFEAETPLSEAANEAYDAVRALAHKTIFRAIPGPHAYSALGNLKFAGGYGMQQVLEQLARGLRRAAAEMDLYEDDGADPALRVEEAAELILLAALRAEDIAGLLEQAQGVLSQQGYREAGEGGPHDPAQIVDDHDWNYGDGNL